MHASMQWYQFRTFRLDGYDQWQAQMECKSGNDLWLVLTHQASACVLHMQWVMPLKDHYVPVQA